MDPRVEGTLRVLFQHTLSSHSVQLILLFLQSSHRSLVDIHVVAAQLTCYSQTILI